MLKISSQIEAILFTEAEPVSIKRLVNILDISQDKVEEGILELQNQLEDRGLILINYNNEICLKTRPEFSEIIKKIQKDEEEKELTKASLEVLSIICYHKSATKSEIDYIRGVNSAISLRTLSIRGLIERVQDGKNFHYIPSIDLMSSLGIIDSKDMPDYELLSQKITGIITKQEE